MLQDRAESDYNFFCDNLPKAFVLLPLYPILSAFMAKEGKFGKQLKLFNISKIYFLNLTLHQKQYLSIHIDENLACSQHDLYENDDSLYKYRYVKF